MTYHKLTRVAAGALALLAPGILLADSISPSSVTGIMDVGTSVTIGKTVTVNAGAPTTSLVDVYFLADTTGSMGGIIGSVQTSASAILSALSGYGSVQFAVGEYKDVPTEPWGTPGYDYDYRLNAGMGNAASAQAGINMWSASGGWDEPESELSALTSAAAETTGWRTGSTRILVWFGDAPGHEPSNTSGYPGPSTEDTITTLVNANIKVEALDVGSMNAYGQASAIATATGGAYYTGIDSESIVAAIQSAISESFATYKNVGLDISEVPAGLAVSVVPGSYTGSYDRSVERTFRFDLTITGVDPGTYAFNVYGTVDGGRVATETDSITVRASGVPDGGSTLLLLGGSLMGLAALRRKM